MSKSPHSLTLWQRAEQPTSPEEFSTSSWIIDDSWEPIFLEPQWSRGRGRGRGESRQEGELQGPEAELQDAEETSGERASLYLQGWEHYCPRGLAQGKHSQRPLKGRHATILNYQVRGSLKSWTKLWCVLKPGLLLLYKTPKAKSSQWIGTIILRYVVIKWFLKTYNFSAPASSLRGRVRRTASASSCSTRWISQCGRAGGPRVRL